MSHYGMIPVNAIILLMFVNTNNDVVPKTTNCNTIIIAGLICEVQFLLIVQFYSLAMLFVDLKFANCMTAT